MYGDHGNRLGEGNRLDRHAAKFAQCKPVKKGSLLPACSSCSAVHCANKSKIKHANQQQVSQAWALTKDSNDSTVGKHCQQHAAHQMASMMSRDAELLANHFAPNKNHASVLCSR